MAETKHILKQCLYFGANAFARSISRMADEEFRVTGLSPSHAILLSLITENQGIGPKEITQHLDIAPSTVTRFLDQLQHRGFIERQTEGKLVSIRATEKGAALNEPIKTAWQNLYVRYVEKVGEQDSINLSQLLNSSLAKLRD